MREELLGLVVVGLIIALLGLCIPNVAPLGDVGGEAVAMATIDATNPDSRNSQEVETGGTMAENSGFRKFTLQLSNGYLYMRRLRGLGWIIRKGVRGATSMRTGGY